MGNTSANDTILGFEYQFYYFLLRLLKMQENEVVGFEVKDDVHVEDDNGHITLLQLKHTLQTNTHNKPKNLTTSDSDLWKTLFNWTNVIKEQSDQLEFIKNTSFVLVTNKSKSDKNKFIQALDKFKEDRKIADFRGYLIEFELTSPTVDGTKNNKHYCQNILLLDDIELSAFAINIEIIFGLDDITDSIKKEIMEGKLIKHSRVNKLFHALVGRLKEEFYTTIKNKGIFEFTREAFYFKTIADFSDAKSERLPFQKLSDYTKNLEIADRHFAKQLLDINIGIDEVYEYDYNRQYMETNLKQLYHDNEITTDDITLLNTNTVESWKDEFNMIYLEEADKTDLTAKKLLYTTIKKELTLAGQKIEFLKASKGQYIIMSDQGQLGWVHDWMERYKDED